MKIGKKTKITIIYIAVLLFIYISLCFIFPLPLDKIENDFSTVHTIASTGELLRITLSKSGKYRVKAHLNEISEYVKKGFVSYEDRTFYINPGINLFSIARAAFLNAKKRRIVSGGSTITMQLAKMMEPKKRTYFAKFAEAFRALQLEVRYSKDQILEIYLNTIPMGGNIEGVAAASYIYFNKPPSELNPAEAALLISLPKKPNSLRPDRHPDRALNARNKVIARVYNDLKLGEAAAARAAAEPIPAVKFTNPYRLPYLVNRHLKEKNFRRRYTIDPAVQSICEYRLGRVIARLKKYGINNGAIMVVKNSTKDVVAYVGNADFADKEHSGEIDCAVIKRSPGSTLKPVLYGRAIENGFITPGKILYDIPREYDGYEPVNAGKIFIGPVTATEGLTHSLNSTAVYLENLLKDKGIYNFLIDSGFTDMERKRMNPGLSVILGAYPMTLEELMTVYSGLADKGIMKTLRYTQDERQPAKIREIFSPETAYVIAEMLAGGERPDLPQSWEFTYYRGKVAFKTGTSFGLRDAWCLGYNPDYTVGVWLGNADSGASLELLGIKAAAPVVMEIFNSLTRFTDSWYVKPPRVKTRRVCAVSGDLPGKYCPNTKDDFYIEGKSKNEVCTIHKIIYINKKSGLRADAAAIKGKENGYKTGVIEDWPPEAAVFIRERGGHMPFIPQYEKDSMPQGSYLKPKILTPINNSKYIINRSIPKAMQKMEFRAAAAGGADTLVWFLNGKPAAKLKAGEKFFWTPEEGSYDVTVQDPLGQSDTVSFKVFEK